MLQGSIHWGGGEGELPPKSFSGKKFEAISNKDLFDDDFKESVKVTGVQKCDFLNTIFSKFFNPPKRPKIFLTRYNELAESNYVIPSDIQLIMDGLYLFLQDRPLSPQLVFHF